MPGLPLRVFYDALLLPESHILLAVFRKLLEIWTYHTQEEDHAGQGKTAGVAQVA